MCENDSRTEREVLLSRIHDKSGGRIGCDDHIILQLQCKNKMVKGLFLDSFEDFIEDGSIFKLVLEKRFVREKYILLYHTYIISPPFRFPMIATV